MQASPSTSPPLLIQHALAPTLSLGRAEHPPHLLRPHTCTPPPLGCTLQAELRQLQPVLEKTAVEVEAMMVRITADKKEAAATQKAVAQQEQEANEQAAQVRH